MSLGLYITTRCNLNCRYCFNWEINEKRVDKSLEYSDICRILAAGREKGHRYLTLTGGEPFVHEDILKIIDYAYELGYLINILTNGLLIDEPTTKALVGKSRLRIRVSLEGASKEIHEYFRGRNTYDRALNAIQRLVRNNINVGIGFTVYRENLEEIEKVVRLCIELGCAFVRFSPVVRLRKGKQAKINLDLHENTLTGIIEAQVKYKEYIDFPGSESDDFSLPIEALTTRRCEAGCNFFAINPEKIILPCPLVRPDAKIFRKPFTGEDDFELVNQHMEELFDDIAHHLKGRCAACEFSESCRSGCPGEKFSFDLTLFDEQPVCFKRILEKIEEKFNRGKDFQLVKKSWIHRIASTQAQEKDNGKFCFRQAPFWTVLFKRQPGRK
jgi:radical SAM protein with 4Fe4S-binding SPASM domain